MKTPPRARALRGVTRMSRSGMSLLGVTWCYVVLRACRARGFHARLLRGVAWCHAHVALENFTLGAEKGPVVVASAGAAEPSGGRRVRRRGGALGGELGLVPATAPSGEIPTVDILNTTHSNGNGRSAFQSWEARNAQISSLEKHHTRKCKPIACDWFAASHSRV